MLRSVHSQIAGIELSLSASCAATTIQLPIPTTDHTIWLAARAATTIKLIFAPQDRCDSLQL